MVFFFLFKYSAPFLRVPLACRLARDGEYAMNTKVVFIFSRFKPDKKGINGYLAMQVETCSYADLSLEEEAGTFSSQMTVEGEYHKRAPAPLSHSLSTLWCCYLFNMEG